MSTNTHIKDKLEKCRIHGKKVQYAFSKTANGWLCLQCAKQGFFIKKIAEEIINGAKQSEAPQETPEDRLKRKVVVCASCLTAQCVRYGPSDCICEKNKSAGVVIKTVKELDKLGKEHPSHYS